MILDGNIWNPLFWDYGEVNAPLVETGGTFEGVSDRQFSQQLVRRIGMTETEKRPCKPDLGVATCMLLAMCSNSSTKFGSSMNEQFSDPSFLKGAFTLCQDEKSTTLPEKVQARANRPNLP